MKVQDVMTRTVEYLSSTATLSEAARKMKELDTGFLPLSDRDNGKLEGVVTDRDIVIRCVAEGKDPNSVSVAEAKTNKVLYCFADDDVESVADNMSDQKIYRLVVLNNREEKKLVGVVSLGDMLRHDQTEVAARAARGIVDGPQPGAA
jgi:CBS domain-containing protein